MGFVCFPPVTARTQFAASKVNINRLQTQFTRILSSLQKGTPEGKPRFLLYAHPTVCPNRVHRCRCFQVTSAVRFVDDRMRSPHPPHSNESIKIVIRRAFFSVLKSCEATPSASIYKLFATAPVYQHRTVAKLTPDIITDKGEIELRNAEAKG